MTKKERLKNIKGLTTKLCNDNINTLITNKVPNGILIEYSNNIIAMINILSSKGTLDKKHLNILVDRVIEIEDMKFKSNNDSDIVDDIEPALSDLIDSLQKIINIDKGE